MAKHTTEKDRIRQMAEDDLYTFIRLVAPDRMLGTVHKDVLDWWTRPEAKDHQLLLLPRDHQKSVMLAFRVAHAITKDPTATFLYVSATATLAEKQLLFIKNIFLSRKYKEYWPEMVKTAESQRAKWTNGEILVDHPVRHESNNKDSTILAAGLTTTITGQHYTHIALDDIVVEENANAEGREKVRSFYSLLSSIATTNSKQWGVGTRYRPADLYGDLMEMRVENYNDEGEVIDYEPLFETFERPVEDKGDGTGNFLWPKKRADSGKWYGFDARELAKKRAQYLDKALFRAQLYNDPNTGGTENIRREDFQYYDPRHLKLQGSYWYFQNNPLNVFASVDFAFSTKKRADWTAIAVVGMSSEGTYYILDLDRFKTDSIADYYQHVKTLHIKWGFRKLRAEVTVAQQSIVREMKDRYIREDGLVLSIDPHRPDARSGNKEDRIAAVLEPKYRDKLVWHPKGGITSVLEEELVQRYPKHDDLKNAVGDALEIATPPQHRSKMRSMHSNVISHPRFGGLIA